MKLRDAGLRPVSITVTTTVRAIYDKGMIKLPWALPLPPHSPVEVTISTTDSDVERQAWLEASKEAIIKTWDNSDDDAFNALRPV